MSTRLLSPADMVPQTRCEKNWIGLNYAETEGGDWKILENQKIGDQ